MKVGLEVHVLLPTKKKLFCTCSKTCPICLGYPGARPVLNEQAVEQAIKLCLALGCEVSQTISFSRKTYFYPDLAKNFQITQHDNPLGLGGTIRVGDAVIRLRQAHLEEDPAAILYPQGPRESTHTLLDYARSGRPLVEVVSEPDLTSAEQARAFLNKLSSIVEYVLGSCELKVDVNVSIPESDYQRVEVKNISGFRDVERAIRFEVTRQKMLVRHKKEIVFETRGWNGRATVSLRKKETEADYGYVFEPDIPPIILEEEYVRQLKEGLPELADKRAQRYIDVWGVEEDTAFVLAQQQKIAELFEEITQSIDPLLAARWVRTEVLRIINYHGCSLEDTQITAQRIKELLSLLREKKISETTARKIMELLAKENINPKEYVEKEELLLVADEDELLVVCKKILSEHAQAVKDYLSGEEKSFHYLTGQVMRETKGRASPEIVKKTLESLLKK